MIKKTIVMLALTLGIFTPGHAAPAFQSLDSIYALVKETVAQHIDAAEYETTVLPLDGQLKLPACAEPLEAFTPTDSIKAGRIALGVRCNGEKKWSIYASAVIKVYETVIVLTQPVQRGETLTRQYLVSEKRDVSKLRGDFITQLGQVENKQAARYLPQGAILGLNSIIEPKLVKRGDKIIISAIQPAFTIRMNGIAMMDGVKDQRIRVKNENSGRVIDATVVEAGLVEIK